VEEIVDPDTIKMRRITCPRNTDTSKYSGHFSAHKKAHKTLDLECLSMTYGVVRAFQVIVNTLLCSLKRLRSPAPRVNRSADGDEILPIKAA